MVLQAINGTFFHLGELLKLTVVQTIDAVQQQKRQHHHERQNFGHPISFVFRKMRLPDDGIRFEGAQHIEYNSVDRLRCSSSTFLISVAGPA